MRRDILFGFSVLPASAAGLVSASGDDEVCHRPNFWLQNDITGPPGDAASRTGVSIARRNADQIEELELRFINLGDQTGGVTDRRTH
jgi:hypothetical protein